MDGSVVIGVSLDSQAFEAALLRLRQSAGQTAVRALENLIRSMDSLDQAFSVGAAGAMQWSQKLTEVFRSTLSGAASVTPQLALVGRQAGVSFLTGVLQGNYYGAGRQAGYQLSQGFADGGSYLPSLALELVRQVRNVFSGGWYDVGYNISAGIAQGVRGGSPLITNAANQAAQQALNAAKKTLGVQSPSRVFRDQVGRMIPAGIAQGVRQGAPELEEAVRRQSQVLVETARRDVRPTLEVLPGGRQAPVVQDKSPIHVTVETPLVVDGREIARATARYTGQQWMWESM